MPTYELGISSSDAVTLYPEFDYKAEKKQKRSDHRTRSGKLYSYKWYDVQKFDFDLSWVNESISGIINSWFDARTELLFFITSGGSTEVHSVMIMNDETPMSEFQKPYQNYYKGTIKLEGY